MFLYQWVDTDVGRLSVFEGTISSVVGASVLTSFIPNEKYCLKRD